MMRPLQIVQQLVHDAFFKQPDKTKFERLPNKKFDYIS